MSDWEHMARQVRHRKWGNRLGTVAICIETPFVLWKLLTADWSGAAVSVFLLALLVTMRLWQPPIVKDVRIPRE